MFIVLATIVMRFLSYISVTVYNIWAIFYVRDFMQDWKL